MTVKSCCLNNCKIKENITGEKVKNINTLTEKKNVNDFK